MLNPETLETSATGILLALPLITIVRSTKIRRKWIIIDTSATIIAATAMLWFAGNGFWAILWTASAIAVGTLSVLPFYSKLVESKNS